MARYSLKAKANRRTAKNNTPLMNSDKKATNIATKARKNKENFLSRDDTYSTVKYAAKAKKTFPRVSGSVNVPHHMRVGTDRLRKAAKNEEVSFPPNLFVIL